MARTARNDRAMVRFCIDRFVDGKPYPNLARLEARPYTPEWRKFSQNWPFSEPVHFLEYLDNCGIEYELVGWTQSDRSTLYPISISYFDFSIDWFDLMPSAVLDKLRSRSLTVWFFYSEGDNPRRIKDHLLQQSLRHGIDPELILFTSANSAARFIDGFTHFVDDECLYQLRNKHDPLPYHENHRNRKFTALVRTHKWWRATTMARFWSQGLHQTSYFSYTRDLAVQENEEDNPIEIDSFDGLRSITYDFLEHCPFRSDSLDSNAHNLYATTVIDHFSDSYMNIVIETHMDADQSDGVFLTEKTFKPIKHCQPFVIVGTAGSIQQLRDMGYRTFDHVIDHSYDLIKNTTQRWDMVCKEIERLSRINLHHLYKHCRDDLIWNQELFMTSQAERVSTLLKTITKACNLS
jgi:hypothetical protein